MKHNFYISTALTFSLLGASLASPAFSQEPVDDEVVVTGTHIKGAKVNALLPVVVLGAEEIDSVGSLDANELMRALPNQGAVDFRNDNNGTVNSARGDISSINLRDLGPGNTLILINGRRVVAHPGTQSRNLVPAVTPNTNALPVTNISRIEVLNDGASSIYGSDAVAGVFNTILKTDYTGLTTSIRYGAAHDSDQNDLQFTAKSGWDFNDGATNLSLTGSIATRNGLAHSERAYSANHDKRDLLIGTNFEGDTSFDDRHTRSPWGQFTLRTSSSTRVRQNGGILTTSSGRFHLQPDTLSGCRGTTATDLETPGICIDDSSLNRELRYNRGSVRQHISDRDRLNAFAFVNHDLGNGIDLFGEAGFYFAETDVQIEGNTSISSGEISIPKNNYYNPFGPVNFSDGRLNPNRLPGLSNVPIDGLPVFVDGARFRFVDVGPRLVNVKNYNYRLLGGARGAFDGNLLSGWDWDSAALFSGAKTNDTTNNRISSTLLQQSLFNETPDTYNFFNGGSLTDPNNADSDSNPQSVFDPFLISVSRISKTQLGLIDFKMSNPDFLANSFLPEWPRGEIGAAVGLEARYESYDEDRDDRLDGTITFTDQVTGDVIGSDVLGTSPTADSDGSREVLSAFAELYVPIIGDKDAMPLIQKVDLQLAARIENYSDVGSSGIKPKVGVSWEVTDFLKMRAAWSEGFRAPNLPQINEIGVFRSNGRTDNIFCEAGVRNGTFATFADCDGFSETREERRTGNPDLENEDSENITAGFVFEPQDFTGVASLLNNLTVTVDRWQIKQFGVVGIFGGGNHLDLDYARRVQGGSNPAIVRAAPTQDQIDFFAGTGLDPAGSILFISDVYENIEPRTVRGTDFAFYYDVNDTPAGDFKLKANASRITNYFINESPLANEVNTARDGGQIDSSISIANSGSLLRQNGIPEWQASASVTWRHQSGFGAGFRAKHVGDFIGTSAGLNSEGEAYIIEDVTTFNIYGQFETDDSHPILKDTRFRIGANNFTNKEPPLSSFIGGFRSRYHSARQRYIYADIRKKF